MSVMHDVLGRTVNVSACLPGGVGVGRHVYKKTLSRLQVDEAGRLWLFQVDGRTICINASIWMHFSILPKKPRARERRNAAA